MYRKLLIALGTIVAMGSGAGAWSGAPGSGSEFAGPGPAITGNDTGGIFPYSPAVEGVYKDIAADYCARWGRLGKVTSIHRTYGDYVSFVCYDREGMIH
jgi:hypothetical protein